MAEPRGDVRHRDAVVAARRRDDPDGRHLVRQHAVERSPRLERARVLHALELQRDRRVDLETEVACVDDERRRDAHMRTDALGGVLDVAAVDRQVGHRDQPCTRAPALPSRRGRRTARSTIEPRWPLALVLFGFIALTIVLRVVEPEREHLGPPWLVPAVEIGLLFALLAADPMHIARRTRWLRPLAITLILLLMGMVFVSDAVLLTDIITGSKVTESATSILASGALVWSATRSCSGCSIGSSTAADRSLATAGDHPYPDFAFPHQLEPRARAAGLASSLRRLLHPRHHDEHGVQPDRRHAHEALGEAHDGRAVADLADACSASSSREP